MTLPIRLFKVGLLAAAMAATVAGYRYVNAAPEPTPVVAPVPKKTPGLIELGAAAPQLSSLRISTVNAAPLPLSEPLTGRVTYDENRTTRVSSPVAGRVTGLHAEMGDIVPRGALLATLDAPDLATAEADWRKAQADELRKKLALERARTLFEGEVIARKDVESALADQQQASAETRRAGLRMKSLHATGSENGQFRLTAPLAGVVADRQINPGLEVRPDLPTPLFVITDLNQLWVIVDVPDHSATGLKSGQAVTLDTDAWPGEHFTAHIDRVGLTLDPGTRRVQVRCAVSNPDHKLKPEMFVRVAFLSGDGAQQAIPLPNTSLFADGVASYVFVEKQVGTFEKRRVNVRLRGRDTSYIDSGLNAGERVVTDGAFLLNAEGAGDAR
ncbi:MAG: cobalt-zinc-cadmium efflux system membrane fusion protein [Burkholderiaceae bacterium]|jgi:cobalt-zinc-cadmium efflux system membrane fusion protein